MSNDQHCVHDEDMSQLDMTCGRSCCTLYAYFELDSRKEREGEKKENERETERDRERERLSREK